MQSASAGFDRPSPAEMLHINEILVSVGNWLQINNPFVAIHRSMDAELRRQTELAHQQGINVPDIRMCVLIQSLTQHLI